jgi:hypothetical protein
MKAISIKQPWAWAILNGKLIENRNWHSNYRGKLLIHASKAFDYNGQRWLMENEDLFTIPVPFIKDYKTGGFIGKTFMVDCVCNYTSPFFFGPWGFVFENTKPIDFIPYKGQLGIFNVPDNLFDIDKEVLK